MARVIVLGSLFVDIVVRAERFPLPGETLIGDNFATFLGGSGCNQAIAAARMGAGVSLIGCVGRDQFGDDFFPALAHEGVDSTYITRDSMNGTGIASFHLSANTGQNVVVAVPRANLTITPALVEMAMQNLLAEAPLFEYPPIFLTQCAIPIPTVITGLRYANNRGMVTILNAAPVPAESLEGEMLRFVNILIMNETEASSIVGKTIDSPLIACSAAEQLLLQGPSHIIITLGRQGCVWSRKEMLDTSVVHKHIHSIPVRQLDATAAGDAFCGAVAASLAKGMKIELALHQATAAGAIAVTRVGAHPSLPTIEEVEILLQENGAKWSEI